MYTLTETPTYTYIYQTLEKQSTKKIPPSLIYIHTCVYMPSRDFLEYLWLGTIHSTGRQMSKEQTTCV